LAIAIGRARVADAAILDLKARGSASLNPLETSLRENAATARALSNDESKMCAIAFWRTDLDLGDAPVRLLYRGLEVRNAIPVEVDLNLGLRRRLDVRDCGKLHAVGAFIRHLRDLRRDIDELDAVIILMPRGRALNVPRVDLPAAQAVAAPKPECGIVENVVVAARRHATHGSHNRKKQQDETFHRNTRPKRSRTPTIAYGPPISCLSPMRFESAGARS
jgi:hypothetical protein